MSEMEWERKEPTSYSLCMHDYGHRRIDGKVCPEVRVVLDLRVAFTRALDGINYDKHELPDHVTTVKEAKAWAIAIWRMR